MKQSSEERKIALLCVNKILHTPYHIGLLAKTQPHILELLSLADWYRISENFTKVFYLRYCPWRHFFYLLMIYSGGLILFPFTVWFEDSYTRTESFNFIGRSLLIILVFLIKFFILFCNPIGLAALFWCAGGTVGYRQKLLDIPIAIWWTLLCGWIGLYFSMRKKNPETKWKWDIACGIVCFLLIPCSLIGYMIYRGVF